MGKSTISMAIFNSYVCLPEGIISLLYWSEMGAWTISTQSQKNKGWKLHGGMWDAEIHRTCCESEILQDSAWETKVLPYSP